MTTVKSILLTMLMTCLVFSDNTLTLTNLDIDAGTVDVYMTNDVAVGGFQFDMSDITITGVSGGTATDAGFTISNSASRVLGFSFTGATIPSGEGVLVSLTFDNPNSSVETCIIGAVMSDATGNGLDFSQGCATLAEGGGCTDMEACNYDADAQFDDGSCEYPSDCADCNGECTCLVDCSGTCGGLDFSCFTQPSDLVGVWSLDNQTFYESLDCTGNPVSIYECDDDGEDFLSLEECEAACSSECLDFSDSLPSFVVFGADGAMLVGHTSDVNCASDDDCIGEDGMGYCVDGFCMDAEEGSWGINNGCFYNWAEDEDEGLDDDCWTYTVDGSSLVFSGIDGDYCQELECSSQVIGCMDMGATNYDASATISCWDDCCVYPAGVDLAITDVSSDNVEVSITVNEEMGGFQFTLSSTCDPISWTSANAGSALDGTDFTLSAGGGSGIVLGFSFTGSTVAAGTQGVLANVGADFNCDAATFTIETATIASPAGTSLSSNLGQPFDYVAGPACPDGETEACDGECYASGGPVEDDCGVCLYSYCYDMATHIPDYMTTEEDCTAAGNMWVNPGDEGDPTWNADMDCAGVCGGSAMEDCAGTCDGSAVEDVCGECGGSATDVSSCMEYFVVDLDQTGINQLVIFQDSITGLEAGDEIGVFDGAGYVNSGDCSSQTAELLVGSGIWTGDQLEVVGIGSVDNCAFGGFQLPGWVAGNSVVVKVYRPSTGVEYATTATYSAGTGTFGDLFMAVSDLDLEELDPPYYNVTLDPTGINQLIILQSSITGLEVGDEIGVHDASAITNSGDCSNTLGTLLVGAGVWTGDQLEVVSVGSVDNCAFGGFQLPGWVAGSSVVYNIYRPSTGELFNATATYSAGTGTFGDLFMAVSELTLDPFLDNDDVWFGPSSYTLSQNYPNPFNPATEISFDAGINGNVSLVVYDILGNRIKTLMNGFVTPGHYVVSWDGTDDNGSNVSSGVYVYTLISSNQTISKRMLLVK